MIRFCLHSVSWFSLGRDCALRVPRIWWLPVDIWWQRNLGNLLVISCLGQGGLCSLSALVPVRFKSIHLPSIHGSYRWWVTSCPSHVCMPTDLLLIYQMQVVVLPQCNRHLVIKDWLCLYVLLNVYWNGQTRGFLCNYLTKFPCTVVWLCI